LHLQLFWRAGKVASVVGKIPHPYEQQAGGYRAFGQRFVCPKVWFYGSDA
jgi:hypothetical protein